MAVDINDILDLIPISPKLIYYINTQYRKMTSNLKFSLGRLNGMTNVEIKRLFNLTDLTTDDLDEYISRFPENNYIMLQYIYQILALITLKASLNGNERLALDTNALLGLVMLGRLKYKYIRVVDHSILEKTLNGLSKKTYIGLHGIMWMVNKVTQDTYNLWMPQIKKNLNDPYPMYRYVVDLRNKFNQIMKVIARLYYYNMVHRNDPDRTIVIKTRVNEIIQYIMNNTIPDNILQVIVDTCKINCPETSIDRINNLNYNVQIYNSMQSHMGLLINAVLTKLFTYMEVYKTQFQKNLDINDPLFIKSFYTGLKRSTVMLTLASDSIFNIYKYDKYEVLAYAFIITLYVDSLNHNGDYYGASNASSISNDINDIDDGSISDDNIAPYDDFSESILDYHIDDKEDKLEAFFEGVIYDQDLFELFDMRGDY